MEKEQNLLITVDLKGKINNMPDSDIRKEALLPLFEAIINSIDAIEQEEANSRGKITVEVIRRQLNLDGNESKSYIYGFKIEDDGIGFKEKNYKCFHIANTTYKAEKGGKGIGRFYWLKTFDNVEISSVFISDQIKCRRKFTFNIENGINQIEYKEKVNNSKKTVVYLKGFKNEYRDLKTAYKTTEKIAQRILEHFLSYYLTQNAPKIIVFDEEKNIDLDKEFDDINTEIGKEEFTISDQKFSLFHIKLKDTYNNVNRVVFCGNNRDVISDKYRFFDDIKNLNEIFYYCAYVTSDYLDQNVHPSRMKFEIPETANLDYFIEKYPLHMESIKNTINKKIRNYLKDDIKRANMEKKKQILQCVKENPIYRRTFNEREAEIFKEITLNDSSNKLLKTLAMNKVELDIEANEEFNKLLKTQNKSKKGFKEKIDAIISIIDKEKKDDLIGYIVNRRKIIDLLEEKIKLTTDNNYEKEDVIHDIIFPRKTTSDQLDFEDHNLWILDEKLAFHTIAKSDKRIDQTFENTNQQRPDIIVICSDEESNYASNISIIEFKRPQENSKNNEPIDQIKDYIIEIKDKKIKDLNLRTDDKTKYYGYALCDDTKNLINHIKKEDMTEAPEGRSYYKYYSTLKAYIELSTYDKIISNAKKRHKIFFHKLGID